MGQGEGDEERGEEGGEGVVGQDEGVGVNIGSGLRPAPGMSRVYRLNSNHELGGIRREGTRYEVVVVVVVNGNRRGWVKGRQKWVVERKIRKGWGKGPQL